MGAPVQFASAKFNTVTDEFNQTCVITLSEHETFVKKYNYEVSACNFHSMTMRIFFFLNYTNKHKLLWFYFYSHLVIMNAVF